jgi:hypothetical protein
VGAKALNKEEEEKFIISVTNEEVFHGVNSKSLAISTTSIEISIFMFLTLDFFHFFS